MSDLISRVDALDAIRKNVSKSDTEDSLCFNLGLGVAEKVVEELPSAEPKTGEWVLKEHLWECDQCGCRINRANPLKGNVWNYNFCPNCGARMLGEGGEV